MDKENMMLVSFIIPNNDGYFSLMDSLLSITTSCSMRNSYEILIAIRSEGDMEIRKKMSYIVQKLKKKWLSVRFVEIECENDDGLSSSLNIDNLDIINELCRKAKGQYLWLWSDNARLLTFEWDEFIQKYNNNFEDYKIVDVGNNNHKLIYPMISRNIFTTLDKFSVSPYNNYWSSSLSKSMKFSSYIREIRIFIRNMLSNSRFDKSINGVVSFDVSKLKKVLNKSNNSLEDYFDNYMKRHSDVQSQPLGCVKRQGKPRSNVKHSSLNRVNPIKLHEIKQVNPNKHILYINRVQRVRPKPPPRSTLTINHLRTFRAMNVNREEGSLHQDGITYQKNHIQPRTHTSTQRTTYNIGTFVRSFVGYKPKSARPRTISYRKMYKF